MGMVTTTILLSLVVTALLTGRRPPASGAARAGPQRGVPRAGGSIRRCDERTERILRHGCASPLRHIAVPHHLFCRHLHLGSDAGGTGAIESASKPLVGFAVLNDNLIK
jgi:hypothetical protein